MHSDILNDACISLFLVKGSSDLKTVYVWQSWEVHNCMSMHCEVGQVVAPMPTKLATFHPPVDHQIVEGDHAI